ncbi:MAG: hypothetical protein ABII64_07835 [Elusimicrobiota bacterium]
MIKDITRRLISTKKKSPLKIYYHGIRLNFYCGKKHLRGEIGKFFGYYRGRKSERVFSEVNCYADVVSSNDYENIRKECGAGRVLEVFPNITTTFRNCGDVCLYEINRCCMLIIDNKTNDCFCTIAESSIKSILNPEYFLHILLVERLRDAGSFFIHASGVSRGDSAVLFIGPSGCGKTTAALSAVRKDYTFLGDDLIMVRKDKSGIKAYSYVEKVKLNKDMIGKFGNVKKKIGKRVVQNDNSVKLRIEDYFKARIIDKSGIGKVYFIVNNAKIGFKRIKPIEALPLIMKNSYFYSRKEVSIKHFGILTELVNGAQTYLLGRKYLHSNLDTILGISD